MGFGGELSVRGHEGRSLFVTELEGLLEGRSPGLRNIDYFDRSGRVSIQVVLP